MAETVAGNIQRTDRSESEMESEGGGKASQTATQCQSRPKNGHTANIYLTDSDEEAIVDFVKDHKELYKNTNN